MTTKDEALKLALEALEPFTTPNWAGTGVDKANEAITALREALASQGEALNAPLAEQKSGIKQVIELYDSPEQPAPATELREQEPVAFEEWLAKQHGDPEEIGFLQALRISYIAGQDSITSPPAQRTWVGLTEQEAAECWSTSTVRTWQAIEAKLKEKNT